MESVVYEDSPLAEYLQGEGVADSEITLTRVTEQSPSPTLHSFAPQGLSSGSSRFQSKIPRALQLKLPKGSTISRVHSICSRAANSQLGATDNSKFLEQFRYLVVASQLLNDHINVSFADYVGPSNDSRRENGSSNIMGALITAGGAFCVVWLIHWARNGSTGRVAGVMILLLAVAIISYSFARRQWLQYLRTQAIENLSLLISNSQAFDVAASTAISLVQEVELVSRGYRLSTPLPPVSRLEDRQSRRCVRLRKTIRTALVDSITPFAQACTTLQPLAREVDLEKYYDIYEIGIVDLQEVNNVESDDPDSLKALKTLFNRLHTTRKILLCCLLALEAEGGKLDIIRWKTAVEEMEVLARITADRGEMIKDILAEEEHVVPPSKPLEPGRERVRGQLRKLNSLSQGVRSLQAKMHVLREESDRTLDDSEEVTEIGSNLMSQFESIGADLRMLMHEWENGKAALASNIDKNEKRISESMTSPTLSLSGRTAVEGSPSDALRALNGEMSSDDEIFEAIAAPRQRSSLTREQRMAKMKEERVKAGTIRENREANTHMLRELETVIGLRERRVTSI